MALTHQLITGEVMHARLKPKTNRFKYKTYYLSINLTQAEDLPIKRNRFGLLSFYDKDHGDGGQTSLVEWCRNILQAHELGYLNGDIQLITMPRVLGYVFNPVSFWLCHDGNGSCRAILCEVNNTFGERHVYVCAHSDHRPITRFEQLQAKKVFHVSPMLERQGHYRFKFDVDTDRFAVWIDHYDKDNDKMLATWLIGQAKVMTESRLRSVFFKYPLITVKAIFLIHWQALKLLAKGFKYFSKPRQKDTHITTTD